MANKVALVQLNKDIMNRFLSDLLKVVENDCKNYFIKKMQQSVEDVVYDAYEPTLYKRRRNKGGLQDPENYQIKATFDPSGRVCVLVRNLTKGDRRAKGYYIDEGIVTGKNFYDWTKSKAYYYANNGGFERDFYSYMELIVAKDDELKRIIERGMQRKGWKIT